ncbi:MAG: glycosyltransferase family 9 protein [Bradyrhizobiaceae bacterium]|nr:glycosyltransferase family 9 protein [Bradyrhizobiaceae bacterium]
MLAQFSSKPQAFLPNDRNVVVEHCERLYSLDSTKPEPPSGVGNTIRKWVFGLLGGKREEGRGLDRAAREGRPPRILVFRYDAVGDYIVTSPFVRQIVDHIPNVEIDVVGSTRNAGLLRSDPFVNEVVSIHPAHPPHVSWKNVWNHARKRRPDVVAALVFTKMTKAAILTAFAGRQAMSVTIEHSKRRDIYGKVFDLQVPHRVAAEHYMETMSSAADALLGVRQSKPQPYIVLDQPTCERVSSRLVHYDAGFQLPSVQGVVAAKGQVLFTDASPGRRYVVVNVSAFSPNRQWNVAIACEVASRIASACPDVVCFVTGGPDAYQRIKIGVDGLGHDRVVQWTGNLKEFMALIAGAALIVTPDTAAVHIAAAAGRPVVALFAELIKVAEWFPYGTEYRALLSPNPNTIDDLPVDFVVTHACDLLQSSSM